MKTGENSHSLGSLLMQRTKESGSNVFAYFKDQAVTLRQLNENSNRIANSLIRTGIKKTEKVAIISHSNLEYLSCEFGVTKAGAVCVPINCQLKSHELSYLLSNADVRLAIVHQNYLDEFLLAQDTGLEKTPYYLIDPDEKNKSIGIDALLESGESSDPTVDVDYADPCCIMYTSGTTGAPKGVVYEHYAILPLHEETYVQQMMDAIGLDSNDTTYLPFALYHILGQVHVVGALRNGGKIALAEKFSVTNFWNDVRKYGATVLVHQGASIPLLLKQIESKDDTQHKARLTVGAGVPSVEIWRRFEQRFRVKILSTMHRPKAPSLDQERFRQTRLEQSGNHSRLPRFELLMIAK